MQQLELRGKGISVFGDEKIYPARVGIEAGFFVCGEAYIDSVRGFAESQDALRFVMRHERPAEYLSQLATRMSPVQVHLPEAVLCGYVSLRREEVGLGCCLDVRY